MNTERRIFIGGLIALSFAPLSERATNPKLINIEKSLREHFGPDADEVMGIAHASCRTIVDENPGVDLDSDEDIDRMTDLAMDLAIGGLRKAGIALS